MKIGLVLPELPRYSETFFNYKIKGLRKNGHEVIVFTSPGSNENWKPDYKVVNAPPSDGSRLALIAYRIPMALVTVLAKSFKAAKKFYLLEREKGRSFPDCVKSIYLNSHILAEEVDRLHFGFATTSLGRENVAAAKNISMSASLRGFDINVYPLKNPGCYDLLWKRVDKIHTISGYLIGKARSMGLPMNVPYMKITPAIRLSDFPLKENPGRVGNPLKILTVGRLNWIKDYETAISSLEILKRRGIEFTYNIAGDGPELERIKFAVHQAGIDDCVTFEGKLPHEKTSELMRNSDIYLQTSLQEGFCVSVLEAQASGLMCVVSDADGLRENVAEGESGFIAKRRDPESFADAMINAAGISEDERLQRALEARERVERMFSMEQQNELFNRFFTEEADHSIADNAEV